MKLCLLFIALYAWIALESPAANAQVQGGAPTFGTCFSCGKSAAPRETRAQKRKKAAACNAAANEKALKGKDRRDYLKSCNDVSYSEPFTPPDWPPK